MRPHQSHARRRWTATTLFALLLLNWLASGCFVVATTDNANRATWYGMGVFKVAWWPDPQPAQQFPGPMRQFAGEYRLLWDYPRITRQVACWEFALPLWLPALLAAAPTAFLWAAHARRPVSERRRPHARRPSRVRRMAKWSFTTLCIVLAIACISTKAVGCKYYTSGLNRCATLSDGAITFRQVGGGQFDVRGSRLQPCWGLYFPYLWRPVISTAGTGSIASRDIHIVIPLWLLTLIAALPTAIVWRFDRRNLVGFCQACGYDLTGNVSGRCPECGEAI